MKILRLAFLCSLSFWSCVEPIKLRLTVSQKILIVDATLTDKESQHTVFLKESNPTNNEIDPALNAQVECWIDGTQKIILIDAKKEGAYAFPSNFKALPKKKYQLKIKLADGREFVSTAEELLPAPPIEKLKAEFKADGVPFGKGKAGAHYVSLDFKDPENERNNYFWTYKLWERTYYCETCTNGRIFRNNITRKFECVYEPNLDSDRYDYACDSPCWSIFFNDQLTVSTDVYTNGKEVKDLLVAKVPFYEPRGCLIEVRQQCVSPETYRFLKLLVEQGQNTGSLADVSPAALVGNIKNIKDPTNKVGGTFLVTSVQTKLLWIDRNDVGNSKFIGLLGRNVIPEPTDALAGRPPIVPCVPSKFTTNIKPIGWVD